MKKILAFLLFVVLLLSRLPASRYDVVSRDIQRDDIIKAIESGKIEELGDYYDNVPELQLAGYDPIQVSRPTYNLIVNHLSSISDEDERWAEEIRIANALSYSRLLHIPFEESMAYLDDISAVWNSIEYIPSKTKAKSFFDSFASDTASELSNIEFSDEFYGTYRNEEKTVIISDSGIKINWTPFESYILYVLEEQWNLFKNVLPDFEEGTFEISNIQHRKKQEGNQIKISGYLVLNHQGLPFTIFLRQNEDKLYLKVESANNISSEVFEGGSTMK